MPSPEFYEAHIIQADGTPWCGHTGETKEKAIEAAEKAIPEVPESTYTKIEVYRCVLVDSIELNP